MRKIKSYFKGVGLEIRRVRWPKKKQLWTSVGVVCIITIVAGLAIYFEDWLTIQVMKGFEDAFPQASSSSEGTSGGTSTALIALFNYIGGLFR